MINGMNKFRNKMRLVQKRAACAPIEGEIYHLANGDPSGFSALVMPSPNMHDIDLLLKAGLSIRDLERNVLVVERDPASFAQIQDSLRHMGISPRKMMTSRPMGLEKRVAVLDGPFDWMNLDMFGPIYMGLYECVDSLAKRCFREGSCLQVTMKCAREHESEKEILVALNAAAEDFGIPYSSDAVGRRRIALFMMLAARPVKYGWSPSKYIPATYREDRTGGKTGITMLCHAVVYRRAEPHMAEQRVRKLWRETKGLAE